MGLIMNVTENITSKFNDRGGSVQDALQSLSDTIAEFNEEAEICAQLRMGRIEETGQAVRLTVESTRDVVKGTSTKVAGTFMLNCVPYIGHSSCVPSRLTRHLDMESKLKEVCNSQDVILGDGQHIIRIMNQLYSFMASNPDFNAVDGTGKKACMTPGGHFGR